MVHIQTMCSMKKEQIMRMQKRQFRIGDLAKQLNVEKFVIRFWEKEFDVSTTRSEGGQRFYSEEDLLMFQSIKTLLYDEGFTIAGAKKQLSQNIPQIIGSHKTTISQDEEPKAEASRESTINYLRALKEELIKLQNML